MQLETFDFRDAATAGIFHKELNTIKSTIKNYDRRIIANDVKILAQIKNRNIEGIITKDVRSLNQYVKPLINSNLLDLKFLDLNIPINEVLGELFPL